MQATPGFNIYSLSESAVTIEFGDKISEDTLQQINGFNLHLIKNPFPGFRTSVPAYTTLTVFYDLVTVNTNDELSGSDCFEKVSAYLQSLKNNVQAFRTEITHTVTIPVCYGGELGLDIEEVAAVNQISVRDVIAIHSKAVYKVYMIGFVPGFAYLGGMDERIATPRKQTPRKAVPVGAVAIAGKQTGIYPLQTPGGWQIIGQTPLKMFDANREQPTLLKAGDNVVFKPISKPEFDALANG